MAREAEFHCHCSARQILTLSTENGLRQWICSRCGGRRILLADYQAWHKRGVTEEQPEPTLALADYQEAPGSRLCQSCGRIMSHYRVGAALPFHIDRCVDCQSIWLDGMEWELLAEHHCQHRLDEILSDRWQKTLQLADVEARRQQNLKARFGEADYERLCSVHNWLTEHPRRQEMLAFLATPSGKNQSASES